MITHIGRNVLELSNACMTSVMDYHMLDLNNAFFRNNDIHVGLT